MQVQIRLGCLSDVFPSAFTNKVSQTSVLSSRGQRGGEQPAGDEDQGRDDLS